MSETGIGLLLLALLVVFIGIPCLCALCGRCRRGDVTGNPPAHSA